MNYNSTIKTMKAFKYFFKSAYTYGLRKPVTFVEPIYAAWYFTNECNLKCVHCFNDSEFKKNDELTLGEKYDVIDQLAESKCMILHFSGGEPLLSKDFFKIAKYAHEKKIIIELSTNGILVEKENAKKISKIGFDSVLVSLDGANRGTHEKIRGVEDSYEKTIQGIKNCVEEKIKTYVTTAITKYNYKEIDGIIELSKNLGVNHIAFIDFVPAGRGLKNQGLNISPQIRHEVFRNIAKKSLHDKNIRLSVCSPMFLPAMKEMLKPFNYRILDLSRFGLLIDIKQPNNLYSTGCVAGRMYFAIESNGNIKPCGHMDIVAGNTKKDRIKDVWNNSEVFKALRTREDLKGNCGKCKDKYICGGCRSRAWIYFKDLKAPDPGCIKNINFSNNIKNI